MTDVPVSVITAKIMGAVSVIFDNPRNFIIFNVVFFVVAWYIMAYALNFDDKTHKLITQLYLIFLFFSLLMVINMEWITWDMIKTAILR